MCELDFEVLGAECRLERVEVLFALGAESAGRDTVADTLTLAGREGAVLLDLHAPDHTVTLDALVVLVLVGRLVLLAVMAVVVHLAVGLRVE